MEEAVVDEQKQHALRSSSAEPFFVDAKPVPSSIQSNRDEHRLEHRREDDVIISIGPGPKLERSYSQTYDGVFANIPAKPQALVLPTEPYPDAANEPPPVQQASLLPY